jgi:DNA-binding transcriptional MerR regulator/quercetin dioxygenase-like cupin family protein
VNDGTSGRAATGAAAYSDIEPANRHLGLVGIEAAAQVVGVSPSAIRLWERQGLIVPTRTRGGARRYTPDDLVRLRTIQRFRTVDGLNAAAIRHLLREGGASDRPARGRHAALKLVAGAMGVGDERADGPDAPLASRLRDLRHARRLTLREAAAASGLSISFISALERGVSGASIAALRRIVTAYGTTLGAVLGSGERGREPLVPASSQEAVNTGAGVRIVNLAHAPTALEPQLFILSPGASSQGAYSHSGEEFMYVLSGTLGVWLDTTEDYYRLSAGDALTFASSVAHRFQALGDTETRLIWVNTPPTF